MFLVSKLVMGEFVRYHSLDNSDNNFNKKRIVRIGERLSLNAV